MKLENKNGVSLSKTKIKGYYVSDGVEKHYQRIENGLKNGENLKKCIYTRDGAVVLHPKFVGYTFYLYNGKKYKSVLVSEDMIGRRIGEFILTRQPANHNKENKKR